MDEDRKAKLSKSILDMKFMKRSKERVEKEEEAAEGQAMYSNNITDEMRQSGNIVFVEASISMCKDLIDGRLSFKGMNPDVEKLMSNSYYKHLEIANKRLETDVNDVEMAKNYSSSVNTISKKFQKKRNRKKFMKPSDDL